MEDEDIALLSRKTFQQTFVRWEQKFAPIIQPYESSRICWASFRRITFKIGIFTYFMPFFPAVSTDFP